MKTDTLKKHPLSISFFLVAGLLSLTLSISAAGVDPAQLTGALQWRFIGGETGGRVVAVAGVPGQPLVYYHGATGGGVWKSEDGGLSWNNISDGYFRTGSIGAIGVAPSDPNVIYVGTGESCLRNDISHGDGVYKSEDAGKTWRNVGLEQSRHISRIRVDPRDPDRVYVAALGPVYGAGQQRGVFRSDDGGANWKRVLYVDDKTGASDLMIDAHNPRVLYAGMWQVLIRPWGIYSGGPGSGLYKSTDGGETWDKLTQGLPQGELGRIGVAPSPAQLGRVWALIEAPGDEGGLYRSEDGGHSWSHINDDFQLRRRHYYYTHVFADTQDPDTVYVLTSPFMKSVDGGRTFQNVRVPHGDTHDLWIAPENNQRMIGSNDGGANVSFDGGISWTGMDNQATRQVYHVVTDNQFPYRVYGAQQDGDTVSVPSRSAGFRRGGVPDRYSVGGGESGYIAVNPENSNIVYAGSYWGRLTRYDHSTGETRNISVSPELPAGRPAADMTYRFNWTFPIVLSPHDPKILYVGANVLFKTSNEGKSWEAISPDLTRNDKSKQQDGRLTQIYDTIFAVVESPVQAGVIWVGTDDGLVQLTRDGGANWNNVTPPDLPEWSRISIIDASPHDAASAYLAANRFDQGDPGIYIYRTHDYGQTWQRIARGIRQGDFARTVREDPVRKGLLFAGTETGVYFSMDDGDNWQSLQLNLPAVPVHDLTVKNADLVAATHGRSFWILDNISPLRQWPEGSISEVQLFKPETTYRYGGSTADIDFYLPNRPNAPVSVEILDSRGQSIRRFESGRRSAMPSPATRGRRGGARPVLRAASGLNRFQWDMRYPDAKLLEGEPTYLFGGNAQGPVAVPGKYQVRLTAAGTTRTTTLEIMAAPFVEASQADLQEQFDLLIKIRDSVSEAHTAASRILTIRPHLRALIEQLEGGAHPEVLQQAKQLQSDLESVLGQLVELRFRGIDDQMLEYPLQLNNKIASLQRVVASADTAPTEQAKQEYQSLSQQLKQQVARLENLVEEDLPELNRQIRRADIPTIPVP